MSKQRRTVSLDEDVDEYLSRDGTNASELVNALVRRHMNGAASEDQIREFRLKQLRDEYHDAAATARRKLERLNDLQERNQTEGIDDETRQKWLRKVRMVPQELEHPVVQDAADELGMEPEEIITEAYE